MELLPDIVHFPSVMADPFDFWTLRAVRCIRSSEGFIPKRGFQLFGKVMKVKCLLRINALRVGKSQCAGNDISSIAGTTLIFPNQNGKVFGAFKYAFQH
jgi:hypothetical protein